MTPGSNLQRCHFPHWRRTSARVNLNFLYEPTHPTCKAQSNICKKFHNKPRESHFVTISFFLILFGRQNKALRSLLFGNQTFVIRLCPVISAR